MRGFLLSLVFVNVCYGMFWKKGVVYYTINKLDYDVHSQDEITSTLSKLQDEICIKFFQQPPGNQTSLVNNLLFISNPDKIKNCQPNYYDFSQKIIVPTHIVLNKEVLETVDSTTFLGLTIDTHLQWSPHIKALSGRLSSAAYAVKKAMPIGYKCINEKAIARMIAEMLRASIEQTVSRVNSFDLIEKFHEKDLDPSRPTLLSAVDRNFINAHYHDECGALTQRVVNTGRRRQDGQIPSLQLTDDNVQYYTDKLWPLGVVMYGVEEALRNSREYELLRHAMTSIELSTCIVFEEAYDDQVLTPKNMVWFGSTGADDPQYGFQTGNQSIKLEAMVRGAPGHTAHTLNNLLRVLGMHMMSNRFDRDNYVVVNWKNVIAGKERLLDKAPKSAWLENIAYDFSSASHAPANYACQACELGATTVQPIQDHLWQKTISMGHRTELSESDIHTLKILYANECRNRFSRDNIK